MKIVKVISSVVVFLVVLFVAIGLWMPEKWSCSKSVTIGAKPDAIYPVIANLKRWQEWSAWTNENYPEMESSYSGPDEGTGSQWNWATKDMGTGWLKLVDASPAQGIHYELFMNMKGSEESIHGQIALEENDGKTTVTWTDSGDSGNSILRKWKAVLVGFMVGKQMSSGLHKLKHQLEN